MSNRTISLDDRLYEYLLRVSSREPDVLRRLRAETATLPRSAMQIAPEQGQFMSLLVRLMGAERILEVGTFTGYSTLCMALALPEQGQFMSLLVRLMGAERILEVGTFTGYSTLCMALALPDEGRIITCDVSEEWTEIARRFWLEVGVADCIEVRLAPALETLEALVAEDPAVVFDFVFIDADKENYLGYYELALELVRPGGLIAVDNVLWGGSVADSEKQDKDTVAIRELNETLRRDQRVDLSLVPIGDGLTLARKR